MVIPKKIPILYGGSVAVAFDVHVAVASGHTFVFLGLRAKSNVGGGYKN